MQTPQIRSILVPTDFSEEAQVAFAHALKLALAFKADLDIFHVEPHNDQSDWRWAPRVLETLIRWGVLPADATASDLDKLGIRARRTMAVGQAADAAIFNELANSHADLVVMATHGRSGLDRWVQPSVTTPLAQRGSVPVLLLPPHVRGFADVRTGEGGLERILVPIDHRPHPAPGFDAARLFAQTVPGPNVEIMTLHVGKTHPETDLLRIEPEWQLAQLTLQGNALDRITETVYRWSPDIIVTVTEGRRNFMDAVRGSTVERLFQRVRTPMLMVPAEWGATDAATNSDT